MHYAEPGLFSCSFFLSFFLFFCFVQQVVFDEEDTDQLVMGAEAGEGTEEGQMWQDWNDNDFFENRPCERCEHHSQKLKLVKSLPPEIVEGKCQTQIKGTCRFWTIS